MAESPKNSFFSELKRRKVVRVAVAYLGLASILLEVTDNLFEVLVLDGFQRPLVIAAAAGLPLVVVLAWVFDLTLKGIERTASVGDGAEATPAGFSARFTRQLVVSGAVMILAMTGVGWRYMPNDGVDFEANRVAVASFINETGDPELDVLGAVVARALSRELEQLQGLVIDLGETPPGGSEEATPSSTESISAVHALAERTRARLVVGGSYLQSGAELLLMVEVYDAERQERVFIGDPILTDPTDPMAGILQAKENLFGFMASMGDVVAMLERSSVLQAANHPNYAAYKEFVRAVELLSTNFFARGRILTHFDSAVSLDSTFVGALTLSALLRATWRIDLPRARENLDRLESMRATLTPYEQAGADRARARVERDLEGEYRAANTVVDLVGTSMSYYLAGEIAMKTNRPWEAREHLLRYDRNRIPHPGFYQQLGLAYHQLESHSAELRLIEEWYERLPRSSRGLAFARVAEMGALAAVGRGDEALDRLSGFDFEGAGVGTFLSAAEEIEVHGDPESAQAVRELILERQEALAEDEREGFYLLDRGRILASLGRNEEAREIFQSLIDTDPENRRVRIELALVATRMGDRTYAEETINWLGDRLAPSQRGSVDQARIAAAIGDAEGAVRFLRQAEEAGDVDFFRLHVRPEYQSIRDDPAFQEYMKPRDAKRAGLLGWLPRFMRPG